MELRADGLLLKCRAIAFFGRKKKAKARISTAVAGLQAQALVLAEQDVANSTFIWETVFSVM